MEKSWLPSFAGVEPQGSIETSIPGATGKKLSIDDGWYKTNPSPFVNGY
jgi:hypothetical protein